MEPYLNVLFTRKMNQNTVI